VSEPDETNRRPSETAPLPSASATQGADPRQTVTGPMPAARPEEPTVGTGSTIAIGCVVGMLLVLVVGILIMLWLR
jgi:hypothetical protein